MATLFLTLTTQKMKTMKNYSELILWSAYLITPIALGYYFYTKMSHEDGTIRNLSTAGFISMCLMVMLTVVVLFFEFKELKTKPIYPKEKTVWDKIFELAPIGAIVSFGNQRIDISNPDVTITDVDVRMSDSTVVHIEFNPPLSK